VIRTTFHVQVTQRPTEEWTAQQIVECRGWTTSRHVFSFMTVTAVMAPASIGGCVASVGMAASKLLKCWGWRLAFHSPSIPSRCAIIEVSYTRQRNVDP
jgi:hypothetical protein